MAKPIQRVRSDNPEDVVEKSALNKIADAQEKVIQDSPFLSETVGRTRKLDRLVTLRDLIKRRGQELTRLRARQLTAEQNVDRALEALSSMYDAPTGCGMECQSELDEAKEAFESLMADRDLQHELAGELRLQIKRFQAVSVELASVQVPKLVDEIKELAMERLDLEIFAIDEQDKPLPVYSEILEKKSSQNLEEVQQAAWIEAQANKDIVVIDAEEDAEDDDDDMSDLLASMPTG